MIIIPESYDTQGIRAYRCECSKIISRKAISFEQMQPFALNTMYENHG